MPCGFLITAASELPNVNGYRPVSKTQRSDVGDQRPDAKEIPLGNIRNPKCLATYLNSLQAMFTQLCLRQTQISKMREVTQHRLKPTVGGEEFAHARVKKFIRVESQHRDVLRSSGRGDRVKHRFRKVFAEKYSVPLQFQDGRHLSVRRQHAQGFGLWLAQPPSANPMIQRRKKSRIPQPYGVRVTAARSFGAIARRDVQTFSARSRAGPQERGHRRGLQLDR